MQNQAKTTINPEEIAKFTAMADEWWDLRGKFKPLHDMNPLRIGYIKSKIQPSTSLLDIGCGGGLISEPMARLGAVVTGIDASEKNIKVASLHAKQSGVEIEYRCTSAEALAKEEITYDTVLALEIIEHVDNIPLFVQTSCELVKQGGLIFYSTLNRTIKSYAFAILGAEYILRWLPRGTHDWKKFVRPSELVRELEKNNIDIIDMQGMVLNPLSGEWRLSDDLDVNYIICGHKR